MIAKNALLLSASVLAVGCAGSLDQPERFESSQNNAVAAADGDAGAAGAADGAALEPEGCDATDLITKKCATAGCHGAAGAAAQLDLETADVVGRLTDAPATDNCKDYTLINGADPSQSLLYLKVTDQSPCGSRMPFGPPLSEDEQACLLEFVSQ